MSDDPLIRFTAKLRPASQAAPAAPKSTLPPGLLVEHSTQGRQAYEAYEAFENEVRTTSVEIRCHRTGLSYVIQYAQMSAIVFNFRTGAEMFFSGGGFGVTIQGRNLRQMLMALRLHTCGTIQDFHADAFVLPEPVDPQAPFVENLTVEVLHPGRPGDAAREPEAEKA